MDWPFSREAIYSQWQGAEDIEIYTPEAIESLRQSYIRHATYTGVSQEAARLSAAGYAAQLAAAGVPVPELATEYEMADIPGYNGQVAVSTLPTNHVWSVTPLGNGQPLETAKEVVENGGMAAKAGEVMASVATRIIQSETVLPGPGETKIIPETIIIHPPEWGNGGGGYEPIKGYGPAGGWSDMAKAAAIAIILL